MSLVWEKVFHPVMVDGGRFDHNELNMLQATIPYFFTFYTTIPPRSSGSGMYFLKILLAS